MSSSGLFKLHGIPLSSKEEVLYSLKAQLAAFVSELAKAQMQKTAMDDGIDRLHMKARELAKRLDSLQAEEELPIDILILHTFAKSNPHVENPPTLDPSNPNLWEPNQGDPNQDPADTAFWKTESER